MAQRNSRISGPITGWITGRGGGNGGGAGQRRTRDDEYEDAAAFRHGYERWRDERPREDRPQAVDHDVMMARYFKQLNRSTSPAALDSFARRPETGRMIFDWRKRGWDLRARALRKLAGTAVTPDPLKQSTRFSTREILMAAVDTMPAPGMQRWLISAEYGNAGLRDHLSRTYLAGHALFAWIQTWPERRPPVLHYDLYAEHHRYSLVVEGQVRNVRMATLQGAMCLGIISAEWDLYTDVLNWGPHILPPMPRAQDLHIVPVHAFMREFLRLGDACSADWGCPCNGVNRSIDLLALGTIDERDRHQNTDILQPYPYRERHTPPPSSPLYRSANRAETWQAQVTPNVLPALPADGDDAPDETE